MGVTVHQPEDIVLPPTMTSMPTGTWMLSGTSVIINGKEVKKDYSRINLESLKVQYGLKMSTFVENFKCSPSLHYAELSVSLTTKRHNEILIVYGSFQLRSTYRNTVVQYRLECDCTCSMGQLLLIKQNLKHVSHIPADFPTL